jgi:hypothetical protein
MEVLGKINEDSSLFAISIAQIKPAKNKFLPL